MPPPPPSSRRPDGHDDKQISAPRVDENKYIPSFISKKPFYVPDGTDGADYLEHQRLQKAQDSSLQASKWYDRGVKKVPAATKFRKGACENCGSMTHKKKDCLSKPRKVGAKWSGKDIQPDEQLEDVNLGWDAKRDRWNGYDAREYQAVVDEYNELEAMKKAVAIDDGKDIDDDDDGDNNGDKYEEETDMGREQSTSTRNLRIREDTAKYLLNLDLDSAKYDPKTRSMVDAGASVDQASALVAEEGFVRKGGDAAEFEKAQRYAWETQQRGDDDKMHLQANPTSGEFLRKKQMKEADERKATQRKALIEKYGGAEYLENVPSKIKLVTESEQYAEYDESGGVKGAPIPKPMSKYPEDIYINNHTSVWGSWWSDFKWGYACCHSTVKNSYCTGEEGKRATEDELKRRLGIGMDENEEMPAEARSRSNRENAPKLHAGADKRKRTIDQIRSEVTQEDMDEYRRKRINSSDPMASRFGAEELAT